MAEAGVAGVEVSSWSGFFVPAGTPQQIIRKIHADTVAALAEPAVREKLEQGGDLVIGSTPDVDRHVTLQRGHATERTISHPAVLRCRISNRPMSGRGHLRTSPPWPLRQLPPATDITTQMPTPLSANSRHTQCSKNAAQ